MTNGRVEVITSVQRCRRWSASEKQELAAASLEAGARTQNRKRASPLEAGTSQIPSLAFKQSAGDGDDGQRPRAHRKQQSDPAGPHPRWGQERPP